MKKISSMLLFMVLAVVPTCFAQSTVPDFPTKLYLIDANTGGPVTAATTTVTVFVKFKANAGIGENGLALSADIASFSVVDFEGNLIMDTALQFKSVPVLSTQGNIGLGGDGESVINLGTVKLINSLGKVVHPRKGIAVNASIEFDPAGGGPVYTFSRASTLIDFNYPNALIDQK